VIILASLVALMVVRRKRLKASRQMLKVEQYLLLSQMNPHFVLNTLSNIQSFIILNDLDKATRYLSGFSALAANILESAGEETIPLKTEIGIITGYLEIQKVRFGNKVSYHIETSDELDPEKTMIPPMLSQPFIENAIDHGIRNMDGNGTIRVGFSGAGKRLVIEIEDDGVGRAVARELNSRRDKGHHGMTIPVTEERLNKMGSRFRGRGKLEITDLLNPDGTGRGTLVRIEVPVY
jgi:sensor histidine kinase YesM